MLLPDDREIPARLQHARGDVASNCSRKRSPGRAQQVPGPAADIHPRCVSPIEAPPRGKIAEDFNLPRDEELRTGSERVPDRIAKQRPIFRGKPIEVVCHRD